MLEEALAENVKRGIVKILGCKTSRIDGGEAGVLSINKDSCWAEIELDRVLWEGVTKDLYQMNCRSQVCIRGGSAVAPIMRHASEVQATLWRNLCLPSAGEAG